ncbi:MAG: hypothetical protein COX20_10425 [Desulfobacterales bacterium CG23_combo_of_CG06-09_8_20_14_all_52_9]|nr:MAG: hypothetical protein COX20_10425 [Desulfobacterales bacterium CG23_combo_of_CG06-09_8_20_14_all_52_9]
MRAFSADVLRKSALLPSRLVRMNSELLLLGLLAAFATLALLLHWPLRSRLPSIYELVFQYLVPFLTFFSKAMVIAFVILLWRWTLPRLRVDQLMSVCWKYMIPLGFVCLVGQGFWLCLFNP